MNRYQIQILSRSGKPFEVEIDAHGVVYKNWWAVFVDQDEKTVAAVAAEHLLLLRRVPEQPAEEDEA